MDPNRIIEGWKDYPCKVLSTQWLAHIAHYKIEAMVIIKNPYGMNKKF